MDKNELWNTFENTGTIENYLKYRNVQGSEVVIENGGINEAIQGKGSSNKGNTI